MEMYIYIYSAPCLTGRGVISIEGTCLQAILHHIAVDPGCSYVPPLHQQQIIMANSQLKELAIPNEKRVSDDESSDTSSINEHQFKNENIANFWRGVYEKSGYEGRHRFDPNYTWTPQEESKLVRKVCLSSNYYWLCLPNCMTCRLTCASCSGRG